MVKNEISKLDGDTTRTDYQKEKDVLGVLENLDSLAHQKTRNEPEPTKSDQIVKEFNGSRVQQTSEVYMSTLKAKLSILSKQVMIQGGK